MKTRLLFLIISALLFSFNSIAQQKEFKFKNFTQEEGLPSNESYFVYRDSKNFLWIATDQGVVRYNGSKMERFDLPDNVVFKIREDNKGRIWFFSHTGKLAYFFNNNIYAYKYNSEIAANAKSILISDGYVKNDDAITISATYYNYNISNSGVITKKEILNLPQPDSILFTIEQIDSTHFFSQMVSFDNSSIDTVFITLKKKNKIIKYVVLCRVESGNQHGGVSFDGKDVYFFYHNKIIRLSDDGSYIVKELPTTILCLYAGKDNKLWVGTTKHGAFLLNADLTDAEPTIMLEDKSISSITSDLEGGIWLSSLENGLYYLKNTNIYSLSGDSSLTQNISRLYSVHDSSLLFTNIYGAFNFSNNVVSTVFNKKNDLISDLFSDDNNNIYLCGRMNINSLIYSFGAVVKGTNDINKNIALIRSSNEIIRLSKYKYLFLQGTTLAKIDFSNTVINNINNYEIETKVSALNVNPSLIFADQKGQVWLGFPNKLYKLDLNAFKPKPFLNAYYNPNIIITQPFIDSSSLFKKGITAMRQMQNGLYAIGIRFGGIALMRDSNIIANITEADGLLSNSIKYLLPLDNQLWAATAKGISVINFTSYQPLKYTITNIGKNGGLYNIIVNQLISFQDNIIAATSSGIYVIEKPAAFLNQVLPQIPLFINSINYYKGDTSGINSISVPYTNNRIKIKYSAICFNSPDEIKYYYRFDNTDTTWQTITGTELILENLPPGIYHLELKAAIPNQNRISEIQKLAITIGKPWWQNNWLRLAGILILIGIVFFIYRNRVNQVRKKEEQKSLLNKTIVELQQTALRSQMNPHFIFNCLTSIQQLIVSGKNTDANDYLVKFARLIRKTLDISARPYIKIIEEKEYLEEYLFLEQLRIPGQFNYSIEIDPELDINKTEMPNMMLQPIVENSIRHGIKHLENRKGKILVSIQKRVDFIFCSVTDNGVGRNGLERYHRNLFVGQKSYGMDIVRKRLELMSEKKGGDFSIEINDLQNPDGTAAGTEVIIQVPYKISTT